MWSVFLPFAKNIINHLLSTEEVRRYLISILRNLAASTDNKLDDGAVDVVESLLFRTEDSAS